MCHTDRISHPFFSRRCYHLTSHAQARAQQRHSAELQSPILERAIELYDEALGHWDMFVFAREWNVNRSHLMRATALMRQSYRSILEAEPKRQKSRVWDYWQSEIAAQLAQLRQV